MRIAKCKLKTGRRSPLTPGPSPTTGRGERKRHPHPVRLPKGDESGVGSGTKFGGEGAKLVKPTELSAGRGRGGRVWWAGSCGEVERGGPREKSARR